MDQRPPEHVRVALAAVLNYLWNDEYADYLETSPLEGRNEHIFIALRTVKRWLKATMPNEGAGQRKAR